MATVFKPGFRPVTREIRVGGADPIVVEVVLKPAGLAEQITVVGAPQAAPARTRGPFAVRGLDEAFAAVAGQVAGWRSLSVRLPLEGAHVVTADRGDGGQPHLRATVLVGPAGEVRRVEAFADQTLGRRVRSISRFLHTGEVLGPAGQTVAGVASAGATVLVWTGLALAARRLIGAAGEAVNRRTASAPAHDAARTDRVTS